MGKGSFSPDVYRKNALAAIGACVSDPCQFQDGVGYDGYAERLVNAYRPRAVVVFAGTNDIHPGATKSPEQLLASYQAFVAKVRADLPKVPIYYIGITPSPLRWTVWPVARAANALIQQWSASDPNLHFIDTSSALMGRDGEPDPDNYRFDRLHLSAQGYSIWRDIIRTRLLDEL